MTNKYYVPIGYSEVVRGGNVICHEYQKHIFRQMFEIFPKEMSEAIQEAMKKTQKNELMLTCITFFAIDKGSKQTPKEIHCEHYLVPQNAEVVIHTDCVPTQLSHDQPYIENVFITIVT